MPLPAPQRTLPSGTTPRRGLHAGLGWLRLGAVAVAGAVAALGWAPVALPAICLLGYAVLFGVLAHDRHASRGMAAGALFALALQWTGQGWVFDALRLRAEAGGALAVLGSALFLSYLALFTALPAGLASLWLTRRRELSQRAAVWQGPLVFAALLTLGEWARSLFFNGVTGLSLGYAFVPTWAAGWLAVGGVYGLSFMAYALAAALAQVAWIAAPLWARPRGIGTAPAAVVMALGLALVLFGGGAAWTQSAHWVRPEGPTLSFRLIQSQVDPQQKFQPRQLDTQLRHYLQTLAEAPADLIVTPETALPVHAAALGPPFWRPLAAFAQGTGSHLFVGAPARAADGGSFNSLFHVEPRPVQQMARYDKIDLMPVGEYAPAGLQWFTRRLTLSLVDLSPGDLAQPLFLLPAHGERPPLQVGVLICHEDGRGRNLLRSLPAANLFINPTDLSWFEGSSALEQGLQIARARALESGRPLLRTANTGITAHIDHRGQVVSRLEPGRPGVLSGAVQPMAGQTPYARLGDWPAVAACLFVVVCCGWRRRQASGASSEPSAR